jgi:hypothetical protein
VVLVWQPTGRVVLDTAGKLLFPRVDAAPGMYRLSLAGAGGTTGRVYVGETDNLRRRLAGNYRNPGPTQQTSMRVNAVLRDHLAGGGTVELAIATAAVVYLEGQSRPLDLTRKAGRLLAETPRSCRPTSAPTPRSSTSDEPDAIRCGPRGGPVDHARRLPARPAGVPGRARSARLQP